MKVKCPNCAESFVLDKNVYDEGDSVDCPECSEGLIIGVKDGRFRLSTEKEKFYEDDEFDDYYED